MLNPLGYATDGYITRASKRGLVIAIAGLLTFTIPIPSSFGSGGGQKLYEQNDFVEKHKRIQRDDDEVFNIIKIFIRCQE